MQGVREIWAAANGRWESGWNSEGALRTVGVEGPGSGCGVEGSQ